MPHAPHPFNPAEAANQRVVEVLASKLRRRQVVGSRTAALETLLVLRQVVTKARFSNMDQLVKIIKAVGKRLVEAQPNEHTVGNTVRKVLHHVREEYNNAIHTSGSSSTIPSSISSPTTTHPTPSLFHNSVQLGANRNLSISKFLLQGNPRKQINTWHGQPKHVGGVIAGGGRGGANGGSQLKENDPEDLDSFARGFKLVLMEAIQGVLDELETVYDNVSKNAKDHIHSDEIILTIGKSKTVEAFLKAAAHNRKYTVIVAETAPSYIGRELATSLSSAGISTFLVPDSSIYALMSRVNKVILGAHAILANGGMFAITGSLLAATAARAHSTPVVVCAGQFKLTPLWNLYHEYGALDFGDPSQVLGFEEGDLVDKVDVVNPYYDYVRPELIDAFITNDGDHPPSSVYRLLKETYDDEDNEI